MSFGNALVFPFPAVQYIPMEITNILHGDLTAPNAQSIPAQIIAGAELVKWRTLLKQNLEIELPEKFPDNSLPVLALNLKVAFVKYRSFFITMAGQEKKGYFQLFTLPQHYFYKKSLCFELYDLTTGERLTRYSMLL